VSELVVVLVVIVALGAGLLLLLVASSVLSHVRRFGLARAALRSAVVHRVAALRALREARRRGPDESDDRARRLRAT
jgi:hypothetical protein